MQFKGKTCLLTGATGGIGEAIAHHLDAAGMRLILVARNKDKLQQLVTQLSGTDHVVVAADLCQPQGLNSIVEACQSDVDLLINSAGINCFGLFEQQSSQEWQTMFELNVLAPMKLIQALLPILNSCSSTIVNVGSGFGSIGYAGYCAYSASKFALHGFTEALRRELADTSVKVLYLAPRATQTEMNSDEVIAMNKTLGNTMDSPERVVNELISLLSKSQSVRFVGWPERFFIKLNNLFPTIVDKALAKNLSNIKQFAVKKQP